jgi:3-oxoacyl-[acyl-carrier protein] reductase
MDLGLHGRVAFVSAASKGLGRASAIALAREGASVAICARHEDAIRATADEIARTTGSPALPIVADVAHKEDIDRAIAKTVEHFGALHIAIANGGGPSPGTFEELDEGDWARAVDSTLMSCVRIFRAALPHLKAARWGRLLVITSSSVREPIPGLLLSNTVRPGLVGLCKTLAKELGPHRITVNNVAPGSFDTDRITKLFELAAKSTGRTLDEVRAAAEAQIPLGRLGEPEELGRCIAFLASEAASYVTGQTLVVDGGRTAGF